jgi:hypothetical protein
MLLYFLLTISCKLRLMIPYFLPIESFSGAFELACYAFTVVAALVSCMCSLRL